MKTLKIYRVIVWAVAGFYFSCTDLNEQLKSELEQGVSNVNTSDLLTSAYAALYTPYHQAQRWVLAEISTDAALAPPRVGDWDYNGVYKACNQQLGKHEQSFMN